MLPGLLDFILNLIPISKNNINDFSMNFYSFLSIISYLNFKKHRDAVFDSCYQLASVLHKNNKEVLNLGTQKQIELAQKVGVRFFFHFYSQGIFKMELIMNYTIDMFEISLEKINLLEEIYDNIEGSEISKSDVYEICVKIQFQLQNFKEQIFFLVIEALMVKANLFSHKLDERFFFEQALKFYSNDIYGPLFVRIINTHLRFLHLAKIKLLPDEISKWLTFYFFKTKEESREGNIFHIFQNPKFIKQTCLFLSRIAQHKSYQPELALLISAFLDNQKLRSNSLDDWALNSFDRTFRKNQFTGLINMGCTCYINSSLQQLLFVSTFSEFVMKQQSIAASSPFHSLQTLFALMKFSQKKSVNPLFFVKQLKFNGEPIRMGEQHDVDEFFMQLFQMFEDELKPLGQWKPIERLFKGTLYQQVKGIDCQHLSSREDEFLVVTLRVKHMQNIYQSL